MKLDQAVDIRSKNLLRMLPFMSVYSGTHTLTLVWTNKDTYLFNFGDSSNEERERQTDRQTEEERDRDRDR